MDIYRPLFGVLRPSYLACALAIGLATPPSVQAADRYFDLNGTTAGYGNNQNAPTYQWDLTSQVWNSNSSGGAGTLSTWSDGNFARFNLPSNEITGSTFVPVKVQLMQSVSATGISLVQAGFWDSLYFEAAAPSGGDSYKSITLTSGTVSIAAGSGARSLIFGNNVEVKGNITVAGNGFGVVQIAGSGPQYNETIKIDAGSGTVANARGTGFLIDKTNANSSLVSRVGDQVKFEINKGSLKIATGAGGATIAELSGTGGMIINGAAGSVLIVNQSTNTTWGGQFGDNTNANAYKTILRKQGAGRLSLTGSMHYVTEAISVEAGSLYINGAIQEFATAPTGDRKDLTVSAGATLGGNLIAGKRLVLSGSTSVVDPGAYGEAGVMTLEKGMLAANGGTFNFNLGGLDANNDAANSRIVVTGGTLTLSGTKVINLYNLGDSPLQTGVAYTLLDLSAAGVTRTAGWDQNWVLGESLYLAVGSFEVVGNQLQVTFNAVPEPSTMLMVGASAIGLLLLRRRRS